MTTASFLHVFCVFVLSWQIIESRFLKNTKEECRPSNVLNCREALFFRGVNLVDYASSENIPGVNSTDRGNSEKPLDAITACFWIKTRKSNARPTVLSYATKERDNEFLILHAPNIYVVVKSKSCNYDKEKKKTNVLVSDGEWHHVCVTWESINGTLQTYKDGILEYSTVGYKSGKTIDPYGMWIIGQDQDRYNGGFQRQNVFEGSLNDLNVWNRVLNTREISLLAFACGTGFAGNHKAYGDFILHGGVQKVKPSCCL